MIRKTVHGDVARALREQAGYTQKELAARLGYSTSQIWRLENDPRQYVSARLLTELAAELTDALGRTITIDDLTSDPEFCPTCRTRLAQSA